MVIHSQCVFVTNLGSVTPYVTTLMIDGVVVGVFSSALMTMGGKKRAVQEKLSATKKWMVEQRIPILRQTRFRWRQT
jgi:hypothetical protein